MVSYDVASVGRRMSVPDTSQCMVTASVSIPGASGLKLVFLTPPEPNFPLLEDLSLDN